MRKGKILKWEKNKEQCKERRKNIERKTGGKEEKK